VNYIHALNLSQPATQLKMPAVSNRVPALRVTSAPGVYELQATSNFTAWSAVTMASTTTNALNVTDPGATNAPRRFYRTRQ
jgi:hypothetical protein